MANIFPTPPAAILQTLVAVFKHSDAHLSELLAACTIRLEENTDDSHRYFNDTSAHFDLILEMPPALYSEYEANLEGIEKQIKDKLPAISRGAAGGNWIDSISVAFQMNQASFPLQQDDKAIARIWTPAGYFRLFISHRAEDRLEMSVLKQHLLNYGICGFVAHKDIKVNREWEKEIRLGLNSMHSLIAIVTPTFHQSVWTNQEIGVALGRGLLVTSVQAGSLPQGFTASIQAMPGALESPQPLALSILDALLAHESTVQQMRQGLIEAIIHSPSFNVSIACFTRLASLEELTKVEAERLQKAFDNKEVRDSVAVSGKLLSLLQKHFPRFRKTPRAVPDDDDIPF